MVVNTSNYVQALQTNADFSFLGIRRGTTEKELKALLGYRLSNKEMVGWEPLDTALVVEDFRSGTFYCKVGNLNVELRTDKGVLSEVYMEQVLDFKG